MDWLIPSAWAQAAGGTQPNALMQLLPLVLMFVVLYFIMIRPQMKKQKEHKAMIDALAKGDEVATAGRALSEALHQASSMMTRLRAGEGTAGQFLTNPDLYNNLDDAIVIWKRGGGLLYYWLL